MNIRFCLLWLLLVSFGAGCTAQKGLKEPEMFSSLEDYKLGPKGGVDLVWSTKSIYDAQTLKSTLQEYDSLMLDQVWLVVDKASASKLDDKLILTMSKEMVNAIEARLGHGFKLVETSGASTLYLSVALTNIETALPVLAVTGRLLPEDSATSSVSRLVMGEAVNSDRITVELLVSDARAREPLVALIDKQFSDQAVDAMIASPESRKEAISLWAERLWTTLSYWNWIKSRPLEK